MAAVSQHGPSWGAGEHLYVFSFIVESVLARGASRSPSPGMETRSGSQQRQTPARVSPASGPIPLSSARALEAHLLLVPLCRTERTMDASGHLLSLKVMRVSVSAFHHSPPLVLHPAFAATVPRERLGAVLFKLPFALCTLHRIHHFLAGQNTPNRSPQDSPRPHPYHRTPHSSLVLWRNTTR